MYKFCVRPLITCPCVCAICALSDVAETKLPPPFTKEGWCA